MGCERTGLSEETAKRKATNMNMIGEEEAMFEECCGVVVSCGRMVCIRVHWACPVV